MIDLEAEDLEVIKGILKQWVPDCEVRAYGSRVKGTARKYSDLDLEIICKKPLEDNRIDALREAFALSDLPMIVDVQDQARISLEFRQVIDQHYETLQKPTEC